MQVASFLQDTEMYEGLILEMAGRLVVEARIEARMLQQGTVGTPWWRKCHNEGMAGHTPDEADGTLLSTQVLCEGAPESPRGAAHPEVRALVQSTSMHLSVATSASVRGLGGAASRLVSSCCGVYSCSLAREGLIYTALSE